MNFKAFILSKLSKTHIPNAKDAIMMRMQDVDLVIKQSKRAFINSLLALKMMSSFLIVLGITLVLLPTFESEVKAFTSYDEVMMLSSTSVYALYEAYMTPVEDDVSFTHVITLRSQLRTMIKYAYTFERLIQTEGNFKLEKTRSDTRYELKFEAIDAFNDRLPFHMDVEKSFKNNQRDQFDFRGLFQSFNVEGDVSFEKDRHMVKITFVKDAFQVKVIYDDKISTYEIELYEKNDVIQTFTFFVDYDVFDRPTLHLSYDKEDVETDLIISRSIISQEMTIAYAIKNLESTYEGLITVNVMEGMMPKFLIQVTFEDGQTLRFQFIRPKAIRENFMPMTNNLNDLNVL